MRGDYQQLVDEISATLGAPATLEDRDFGLIAFGAHEGEDDEVMDPVRTRSILQRRSTAAVRAWFEAFGIARARTPLRIPPDPAAGVFRGRICLPVRHRDIVHGYVWLLDDGHLSDLALGGHGAPPDPRIAQAMETAARIGALLADEARAGSELGDLLHVLLVSEPAARPAAATALRDALRDTLRFTPGVPLTLVAVVPWASSDTDTTPLPSLPGLLAACPLRPGPQPPVSGPALAALVRLRSTGGLTPARTVAEHLLRSPRAGAAPAAADHPPHPRTATTGHPRPPHPSAAGIGIGTRELADLPIAWQEALNAARAARAEPRLGPIAQWDAIGSYRMLTALPATDPDPVIGPLLTPAHAELARTAEVFLDCAGQASRTAQALGIHRQTLYYRLGRVEKLTGLDLDDGEHRLLLHMALKASRL
ncbi:helix-turn-helix domain-containing protein [Streptomyces sp. NPDC048506]|uniref:PucR family transcriptional regulator n=1 Tax=Streptomyces sp. NPDC048506 TaxID=3155028 RepID=UPI00343B3947